MAKERGLFRIIFKAFFDSLTPNYSRAVCIGEDYYGTKYYEYTNVKSIHNKPNRYFVSVNKKHGFDQEIPAEWEAWLRNRRKLPPTKEELEANYQLMIVKKKNAAELEEQHIATRKEVAMPTHTEKPVDQHASMNFPTYDEYKHHGQDYQVKYDKKNKT